MPPEPHDHEVCRALFARLSELIDRELTPAQSRRFERHLRACRHCQVCAETLRRTVELCRRAGESPVSGGLARRLQAMARRLTAAGGPPTAD
jgi:anti-sigma factor RsiW